MVGETSVQKKTWSNEIEIREDQIAAGIRKVERAAWEDWLTEER